MPYKEHLLRGISLLDQEIVPLSGTAGKENSLLAQQPYRIRILMAQKPIVPRSMAVVEGMHSLAAGPCTSNQH